MKCLRNVDGRHRRRKKCISGTTQIITAIYLYDPQTSDKRMEILLDSCVLLAARVKRSILQNGMEWTAITKQYSFGALCSSNGSDGGHGRHGE